MPETEALTQRWKETNENGETRKSVLLKRLRSGTEHTAADDPGDLRYIDLQNETLSGLDFSGADLTGAILTGANFSQADLRGANLYKTNIEKCEFLGADMTGATISESKGDYAGFGNVKLAGANLFHSSFIGSTFTRADLSGADLRTVNLKDSRLRDANLGNAAFTRANLQNCDLAGSSVAGASFNDVDFQNASLKLLKGYREASWIGSDIRNVDFHGAYLIRRYVMDENYLHEFRNQSRWHEILFMIWSVTSDCGRSFGRWAVFVICITLVFAFLYTQVDINYGPHEKSFFTSFYFSVVTITTLGYGEIQPISVAAKILSILEVTLGYCSLGGLLSLFATKMSRRAD